MSSTMEDTLTATAYLLASNEEQKSAIAKEVASQLTNGTLKLSTIVASLAEVISLEDKTQKEQGSAYIAAILENVDDSVLGRQDVNLLVNFLKNTFNVVGLKGNSLALRSLVSMRRFIPSDGPGIITAVFGVTQDFSYAKVDTRLEVYKLIYTLLTKHREPIRQMGSEFMTGFAELAAIEKDPRCLMMMFSIVEVFLVEWEPADVATQTELVWELLIKYFPIRFKPKAGETVQITRADLNGRLGDCLKATSEMAQYVFPRVFESLDNSQLEADVKVDTFTMMKSCISAYKPVTVAFWAKQIWDALKYEVFKATEDGIARDATEVIREVATRISYGLSWEILDKTPLHRYLDTVIAECSLRLSEDSQRWASTAGQLLSRVATASPFAYDIIIEAMLPFLIKGYRNPDAKVDEKRAILNVINTLIAASFEVLMDDSLDLNNQTGGQNLRNGSISLQSRCLLSHRDDLTSIYFQVLGNISSQEPGAKVAAIQGLENLIKAPELLDSSDARVIIEQLNQYASNKEITTDEIRKEAIKVLRECAILYSNYIRDYTFPALLAGLPATLADNAETAGYADVLEAFGQIASKGPEFETYLRRMVSKLDVVVRNNRSQKYAHLILASLLSGIQERLSHSNVGASGLDVSSRDLRPLKALVESLLTYCVAITFEQNGEIKENWRVVPQFKVSDMDHVHLVGPDDNFLNLVGRIILVVIRSMSFEEQAWIVPEICTLFGAREFAKNADIESAYQQLGHGEISQTQLDPSKTNDNQKRIWTLSMFILAGLRREHILLINPKTICNDMITYFSKSDASMENVRISMLGIVALLVNKFGAALDSASPKIPEALAKILQEDQSEWSDEQSIRNLSIVCCVAMAVGYRGDSSALALLLKTITDGILTDTRFGSYCSLSFTLILQDGWNLSAENFCIMRRLYKQKVFSIVVPFLLDQSREPIAADHPNIKSNILIALVGIFANVPGDMVLQEIDRIVPVCLAGMDSLHPTVRLVSIQTITWALTNQPGILDGHISALVKRLVRVLQTNPGDGDYATKEIRLKALACLKAMPKELRIEKILPYRDEVLKALKRYGIVDRRRAVRALGVDCQMDWWKLVASTD